MSARAGAHESSRRREPVRQVARCGRCREQRLGWTRFETMAHGDKPAGHPVHFCDGCDAAIIERPLLDVLFDIAGSA